MDFCVGGDLASVVGTVLQSRGCTVYIFVHWLCGLTVNTN